jgi:hypothetical protein
MYQTTLTTCDSFLKSTYGGWFRLSAVTAFDIADLSNGSWYVTAELDTGASYRIGPAGHESREKAAKWLAEFVESLRKPTTNVTD